MNSWRAFVGMCKWNLYWCELCLLQAKYVKQVGHECKSGTHNSLIEECSRNQMSNDLNQIIFSILPN